MSFSWPTDTFQTWEQSLGKTGKGDKLQLGKTQHPLNCNRGYNFIVYKKIEKKTCWRKSLKKFLKVIWKKILWKILKNFSKKIERNIWNKMDRKLIEGKLKEWNFWEKLLNKNWKRLFNENWIKYLFQPLNRHFSVKFQQKIFKH